MTKPVPALDKLDDARLGRWLLRNRAHVEHWDTPSSGEKSRRRRCH